MNFVGVQDDKDEWLKSELPALEQLSAMGYEYKSQSDLNKTQREYREVLLYDRLEAAIRRINPELDEDGVYDALSQISESSFPYTLDHMDTNEKIRAKLVGLSRSGGLEPITVTQNFGDGNEEKTVKLFDFDNPETNDFLVTNQFQLEGLKEPIFPDIIIFVNGIPLVVIECKSPYIPNPIEQAVERNFERYQSREAGYDKLIFYNHFLIATCGIKARHGTIDADVNHYARWSEAFPLTEEDVEKMCNGKSREQEVLIAGMLSKSHLLDLLKNYVIYEVINNKGIKKIAKHQQFRVVSKSVSRLKLEEDISDKGGVIWHTQGSGKSLSMLWLATQLMYKFGNPPILIVTDRKQLDKQIHGTFKSCGFPEPEKARNRRHLELLLRNPKGKTIMTTIQKFGSKEDHIHTDEKVIALVDEGHRTQYKFNALAMRTAMPNAVFFAFSGTPIDKKNRSTYKVFGPLLDKYTFEESKEDGATLQILYEDRMPELFVEGADTINQIFERVFADLEKETKDKLKKQYVTKEKIAEAPERIKTICENLVEHYTTHIKPNGYKAMIVATSREGAVTYKKYLDRIGAPKSKIIMTSHLGERGKDGSSWDEYFLTPDQREEESDHFKDPNDSTQILIVVDMLLVGYDVPIVQVMYLDKGLREHTLLQAIARVNRPYDKAKTYGLIVDYCGITKELQKALAIFEEEDIKGALEPAEKELEDLGLRHLEAMSFFKDIDKNDDEAIIEEFEPVNLRDDFEYAFKMFSRAMDAIMPRKEAKSYISDFKDASKIRQMIRTYYEGGQSLRVDGKKVQVLIDDHIRSLNISELMNPKEITYDNFLSYAAKFKSERARTALIKNKARQIIRELAPNNPVYYEKLRERLEKIIKDEEERRKENADYFNTSGYTQIYQDALNQDKEHKKLGFSNPFEFAVYSELQLLKGDEVDSQKKITKSIYDKLREETQIVGWKTKTGSEKEMIITIYDILSENKFPNDKIGELAVKDHKLGEAPFMTRIQEQKLHYGTSTIDYSIVRSRRRKTSEIIVDAENVIVRTPYHKSTEEIREIVSGKANWIRTKQSEYKLASPEIVRPVFEEGSTLPYLGRNYPFRIVNGQKENDRDKRVKLVNDVFLIFSKSSRLSKKHMEYLYEEWLLGKAQFTFEQKTKAYCMELTIQPPQVIIKNLKNRWGSATKDNVINLNVNLLKAPESVIDYIILHELCHLKIKEHSHHFWDMLHKFMPDYQEKIEWLRISGSRLV